MDDLHQAYAKTVQAVAASAAARVHPSSGYDARIDLIKVVGSIGVVLVHTSMFALGDAAQRDSAAWWLANLGNSAGRNASMLFAMVAGAVLLARPIEQAPGRFIGARWSRIMPALAFWSTFYFLWRLWQGSPITLAVLARDLWSGQPYFHLWFLFAIAGLYVLMPGVRLWVRTGAPPPVAWAMLAASMGYVWVFTTQMAWQGSLSSFVVLTPLLVPYLLAGYLLYHAPPPCGVRGWAGLAAACLLGIVGVMGWLYPGASASSTALMQFLRVPLTFGWTFGLFALLTHVRLAGAGTRIVQAIAPVTLGIYAIHPFWIDVIERAGFGIKQPGGAAWLLYAVLVYGLSTVSVLLLARLPGIRRAMR